jgi:superfamily II helicase
MITYEQKQEVRQYTNICFKKVGLCEICNKQMKTTWHHKSYVMPITRKDIVECCRKCHDIIDREKVKWGKKKGIKLKKLCSKRDKLKRLDKIIDIDIKLKELK